MLPFKTVNSVTVEAYNLGRSYGTCPSLSTIALLEKLE